MVQLLQFNIGFELLFFMLTCPKIKKNKKKNQICESDCLLSPGNTTLFSKILQIDS